MLFVGTVTLILSPYCSYGDGVGTYVSETKSRRTLSIGNLVLAVVSPSDRRFRRRMFARAVLCLYDWSVDENCWP